VTATPPVIFIIFNRPDATRQVFETIRAARPSKLLVIADGPRANQPGEAEKCAATREIIDGVDWDCEVQRNFAENNLGCRLRVSSGLTWAFELVDKAIILEDDCLGSDSFFLYCAELLDRYESDERIMMISGNNFLLGRAETADSYYFSRYPHVWGWATWRRAWANFDLNMTGWPEIRDRKLFDQYLRKVSERYYWESVFQHTYDGKIDSWAYPWVYSIWANSGLSVAPAQNLVRNVGFDADATHTKSDSAYSALAAEQLSLPLAHPPRLVASKDKDELEAKLRVGDTNWQMTAWNKLFALQVLLRRAMRNGKSP
jgi:hypothetical protein